MKSSDLAIGDMAARFGLEPHVLRHWEDAGLLTPGRDGAGRRRYSDADRVRIAVILCNKNAGMGLDRIGEMLRADPAERNAILREHLGRIEEHIAELERARGLAEHALRCRARDAATCPRFQIHASELSARGTQEKARAARERRAAA